MRKPWILIALLALAPLTMAPSCSGSDKFRNQQNLLGVVELGPSRSSRRALAATTSTSAEMANGPFEKINQEPVLGGTRLMVPMLDPAKSTSSA